MTTLQTIKYELGQKLLKRLGHWIDYDDSTEGRNLVYTVLCGLGYEYNRQLMEWKKINDHHQNRQTD